MGSANHLTKRRKHRFFRQLLADRLGHTEIDNARDWFAVVQCDENVGRLYVSMNDTFLVSIAEWLGRQHRRVPAFVSRPACFHHRTE